MILVFAGISKTSFSQVYAGEDQEICSDTTTLAATNPYPETGY